MTSTISEAALVLSQWIELSILGKATILLVMGLTAAWLIGRARASVRHLLLAATFATLLALPLITVIAPAVTIEVPIFSAREFTTPTRALIQSGAPQPLTSDSLENRTPESAYLSVPSWQKMIRSVWIAGAMLLLISLVVDLRRLRRIRRDGLPWLERREFTQTLRVECGVRRSVEVLVHEEIPAPLTCGVWCPAIVMPSDVREWSEADLRRALVHELEHVRRGDWLIQLAARMICAFYWFHPLVWVAWRRLSLEAERAADDAVVRSPEHTEYAEQLVSLAQRLSKVHAHPALGIANRSDLSRRVSALLDDSQRRGRAGLLAAAIAIAIACLIVVAIAPVRVVAQFLNVTATTTQEPESQNKDRRGRRSGPLDRALYEAAENGETSEIDQLLNAGANVNCAIDGDGSPLIGAARKGHLVTVRLLLDRGADPNMPVRGDGNPLIMAAREGHTEVVTLLLDRGASVDQMVPDDENALIQASGHGHLNVVKLLVSRSADVNARVRVERDFPQSTGEWRTPLSMARKGGHDAVVAFLLAAGARE